MSCALFGSHFPKILPDRFGVSGNFKISAQIYNKLCHNVKKNGASVKMESFTCLAGLKIALIQDSLFYSPGLPEIKKV